MLTIGFSIITLSKDKMGSELKSEQNYDILKTNVKRTTESLEQQWS